MLGLEGGGVTLAYILTFLSAVLCIVYGILNWNPSENEKKEIREELAYEKEDPELTDL